MKKIQNILEKKEQIIEKAELFKALAHPIRLCIVNGLISQPGCNVSKIKGCLDIPQSTVSQHLAKLKGAGVVEGKREGLEVYYYVINDDVRKIVRDLID